MYFSKKENSILGAEPTLEETRLILELVLLDNLSADDCDMISESTDFISELKGQEYVSERTIVKMDKKARLQRAIKAAVFTIARRKKDVKFKKLLTVWRMERTLEAYLFKKYYSQALPLAKASLNRRPLASKPSNANKAAAVNKAVEKAKSQFNNK